MTQSKLKNLRIFGDGIYPGGTYNKVSIHGQGRIHGDIQCAKIRILGDSKFDGKTNVDQFKLFGSTIVNDEIKGKKYNVFGSLDVIKKMTGEICHIRGWLTSKGSIEMEKLDVKGGISIDGLLNAGEIKIRLHHATSRVLEMGGEKITVKSKWFNFFGGRNRLNAKVIEGDKIYLEHTTAKVVRGNEIILGPHCEIELVEYQKSYKQDKSAKVHEVNQI